MNNLSHLSNEKLKQYHTLYSNGIASSKRFENRKINLTDTKFLYHVVRLLLEAEMILVEGDLDLQRHREQLKAIRRGEWTEQDIRRWFSAKEAELEKLYHSSSLRYKPDEAAIKQLLLDCLECHYGKLDDAIVNPDQIVSTLREISTTLEKVKHLI